MYTWLQGLQTTIHRKGQIYAMLTQDERTFGMLSHLLALSGLFIPLGNIIGPLVIWLLKKDQYPFVNDQGKESLNFQISIIIYGVVAAILLLALIGIVLLIVVGIFAIVMPIIASVRSNEGVYYRYPLTIRFIK